MRRLFPWARAVRARLTFCLFTVAVCLAAAPLILDLCAPDLNCTIRPDDIKSWGGSAWAEVVAPDSGLFELDSDHGGVTEPPPVVTEDGVLLGPAHIGHDEIRSLGHGRFSLWGNILVFSTSDGTDSRDNERIYHVSGRTRPKPAAVCRLLTAASATAVFALCVALWGRKRIVPACRRIVAALLARRGAILLAAAPPTLAALCLARLAPPTLSSIDSAVFMTENLDLVPLYGPVYMALIRAVEAVFSDARAQIVALQLIQHGVTVLGTTILATSCRGAARILLVSTLATIGGSFGLFEHGVSADALAIGESAALLGLFFRIVQHGSSTARLAGFSLLLALLALTRYHFLIFGAVLPIYTAIRLILSSEPMRQRMRDFVHGAASAGAGLLLMAMILWLACLCLGTHPTLYTGRQGTHRMAEAAQLLPPDRRSDWIETLEARSSDPPVRAAIRAMASGPVAWGPAWHALQRNPALWGRDVDAVEDDAFHVFAFALDDAAVRAQWRHEASQFFGPADGFWESEVEYAADAARTVIEPGSRATYPWLDAAARPADAARWTALAGAAAPWLIPLGQYLALKAPLATAAVLALLALCMPRSDKRRSVAAIALLLTMILCFAGITFSNILQLRHLLPETILAYAALASMAIGSASAGSMRHIMERRLLRLRSFGRRFQS
jgi:hypothetical protein